MLIENQLRGWEMKENLVLNKVRVVNKMENNSKKNIEKWNKNDWKLFFWMRKKQLEFSKRKRQNKIKKKT